MSVYLSAIYRSNDHFSSVLYLFLYIGTLVPIFSILISNNDDASMPKPIEISRKSIRIRVGIHSETCTYACTPCHLERTDSQLQSLTLLPVRLSVARIVIPDDSPSSLHPFLSSSCTPLSFSSTRVLLALLFYSSPRLYLHTVGSCSIYVIKNTRVTCTALYHRINYYLKHSTNLVFYAFSPHNPCHNQQRRSSVNVEPGHPNSTKSY